MVSRTGDDTLRVVCCAFVRLCVVCVVGVQCVGVGVCVGCVRWCWCWCVTLTLPPTHPSLRVYVQNAPVCTFKTSPCVPAPRPQVLPHAGVVPGTHGDVLNVHTGFSACHTTPHAHTTTTTTYTTQHSNNTQHHTERETEKEDRERERSQDESGETQDKTKEKREEREDERGKMKEKREERR